MKKIVNILFALFLIITFNSCETYGDYDTEYSAIYPMSGQWMVSVKAQDGTYLTEYASLNTYNTAKEDSDKMWIRVGSATVKYGMLCKISCNLGDLSFTGNNAENLAGNVVSSENTITITNGKIILDGITAPSGTVTDKIEFTFSNSLYPGETFTVEGYRFTGWPED